MQSLTYFMFAGVIGLVFAVLVVAAYRFTLLGAGLVLTVFLCEAYFVSLPAFDLGSIALFPQDTIFGVLILAGTARFVLPRLLLRRKFTWVEVAWLAFGGLALLSFLQGTRAYGLGVAGVEFRQYFYFFAGALYFLTSENTAPALRKLTVLWLLTAGVLLGLVLFRWMAQSIGLQIASQWSELLVGGEMRVLNAAQTLFLAQAFFLSLFLWLTPRSSWIWRSFAVFLLPAIVLLQHRTVWILCFACMVVLIARERQLRSRVFAVLAVGLIAGVIMTLILFGGDLSSVTQSLYASTTEALNTQKSTFTWRLFSWRILLAEGEQLSTFSDYLLGRPFGEGYERFLPGTTILVEQSPHNYYVQTILRTGLLGLILLIGVYGALLVQLRRFGKSTSVGYFGPRALYVLLIAQLVFFIAYSPNYEQGILLGLAISVVSRSSQEKVAVREKSQRRRIVWASHA